MAFVGDPLPAFRAAPPNAPRPGTVQFCSLSFTLPAKGNKPIPENFEIKKTCVTTVFHFSARAGVRSAPGGPGKSAHAPGLQGRRARGALCSASATQPASRPWKVLGPSDVRLRTSSLTLPAKGNEPIPEMSNSKRVASSWCFVFARRRWAQRPRARRTRLAGPARRRPAAAPSAGKNPLRKSRNDKMFWRITSADSFRGALRGDLRRPSATPLGEAFGGFTRWCPIPERVGEPLATTNGDAPGVGRDPIRLSRLRFGRPRSRVCDARRAARTGPGGVTTAGEERWRTRGTTGAGS
jgi:hypothetical protein